MALGLVQPTRDVAASTPKFTDIYSPKHIQRPGYQSQAHTVTPIKIK